MSGFRSAKVKFEGVTAYSASAVLLTQKEKKEGDWDFEQRIWRERLNVDSDGCGVIPAMAFKNMLDTAAKRYPTKLKGTATFTKFFVSGVLVEHPFRLEGVTRENVKAEKLYVPSQGVKGGEKRVWKLFPIVHKWGGDIVFTVLEDSITEEVFEDTIKQAFPFVGLGRFRPERGGLNGRARLVSVTWSNNG
jgi:hypothetical protein